MKPRQVLNGNELVPNSFVTSWICSNCSSSRSFRILYQGFQKKPTGKIDSMANGY